MNLDLQQIIGWLNSLYGMPKVGLVFIFCLAFGFILKRVKPLDNSAIPGYVALWGGVWLPALSDWPNSSAKNVTQFILLNIAIGFIVGTAATLLHRWAFKPLLAKLGVRNGDTKTFKKSDFPDSKPTTDKITE